MWYAIISEDVENSLPLRKLHRAAHIERLEQLAKADRLLIAGPHPAVDSEDPGDSGFSGSLIVAHFENLQAAQDWAGADPYVVNRIHANVAVKPFRKVLP